MKTKTITTKKQVYVYDENEKQEILKRILDKRKNELNIYWDYNDKLTEEQVYNILMKEDGLNDIEMSLYDCNTDYMNNLVYEILEQELNEQEKTDENLKEFLRDELYSNFNLNIEDLLKYSSIRLRFTLLTNEDFIYIPEGLKNNTIKRFMKTFKGCYDKKQLEKEFINMMGSDYAHIVFYCVVKGKSILNLKEQIKNGKVTLNKCNFGLFNYHVGAGSVLECEIKKPITLNLKDWCDSKNSYYTIRIEPDFKQYGIQQTYNLTSSAWIEEEF